MKSTLLLFNLFMILACQSSLSSRKLAGMKPVEQTYASFAQQRIETSSEQLLQKLESVAILDAQTTSALHAALQDWRETLSLFVHVFPKPLGRDPFPELLQEADSGIFLLESSASDDAIMWWVQLMMRSLRSEESQVYRRNLNEAFAARRLSSEMPLYYWSGVNFIPALQAGVDSNLQDYFREQSRALRKERTKVLNQDPLFPDQDTALEAIQARTQILLRLYEKYRFMDEDESFRKELRSTQGFCELALRDLKDHRRLRAAKDEGRASILSAKIQRDWQVEKARDRSAAQTERDHQHGRD